MKNIILLFIHIYLTLIIMMLTTGCEDSSSSSDSTSVVSYSSGDKITYTVDSISFDMIFVPENTFPDGAVDFNFKTVHDDYWIGETEITYKLWNAVYIWATDPERGANRYYFANAGVMGNNGGVDTTSSHPVTTVNCRDAIVFCNALTEWYNAMKGTGYTCVYYTDAHYTSILRDSRDGSYDASVNTVSGSFDRPFIKTVTHNNVDVKYCSANGFRLLTNNEWELAARWRSDATNTVTGYSAPYFTKGNSASGAYTFYNDATDTNPVNTVADGKEANDMVAVYSQYWDGSVWKSTGVTGTAAVKSKGVNGANSLGLYDMSGNVFEWCFDISSISTSRILMGGCWFLNASYLQIDTETDLAPFNESDRIGFRLGRSNFR